MKRRVFMAACGLLLVVMAFCVATHRRTLPYALKWLDVGEPPTKADAVFVLLGSEDIRPFVAAALYNTGFVKEILLSATPPLENKYRRPMDEIFQDVMRKRGVPPTAIHVIGAPVRNTMKESEVLSRYLHAHPTARVLVVTTHFHTRRTRWSLRNRLGPLADRLHFVSAPHDDFDATNWWLFPEGFELICMEYLKLTAYWMVYGHAMWYALMATLAVVGLGWRRWRRSGYASTTACVRLLERP